MKVRYERLNMVKTMEDMNYKTLGVKEWFADKNGMVNYVVDTVLEIRDKAVKISMTSYGNTFTYWCPKSCLEIRTEVSCFAEKHPNLDGKTLDEVIDMFKCNVSFDELVKLNKDDFNSYR